MVALSLLSHYDFLIVLIPSHTFLSTTGILCVFCSILNNRKHVSVLYNQFIKMIQIDETPETAAPSDKDF